MGMGGRDEWLGKSDKSLEISLSWREQQISFNISGNLRPGTPNQLSWLGAGLSITKSGVRFPLKGRICGRGDPKLGKGLRIPRIPRHPGIAKVSPLAVQSSSPGCQPIRRWTCGIRSRPEGSPTEEQRIGFRRNSYSPRGNGI